MAVEGRYQPAVARKAVPAIAWAMTGLAIAAIWLGVVLSGMYAPDLISGSQHEHLAIVAGGDWIWGLVATAIVILAAQKGFRVGATSLVSWVGLAVGIAVVWIGVAMVSAWAPVWVTGTDPTTIPANAMGVPILGTFLTWFACMLFRSSVEQPGT
jgi:hypothetical protein